MGWVVQALITVAELIVIIYLIGFGIKFWYIPLGIGGIFLVIHLIFKVNPSSYGYILFLVLGTIGLMIDLHKKERSRAAAAEREKAEATRLQHDWAATEAHRKRMILLGEESLDLFESTPQHLSSAEKYLDQAEIDFTDGAFAPFWDSIENAVSALGRFDEGVHDIKENVVLYTELAKWYDDTPPSFPLRRQSLEKLAVCRQTTERMKTIVRTAQRNFQFAAIYEQHKTNQILVAGFTNLAQALDQMTWQIMTSIEALANSVNILSSTLNESMPEIYSQLDGIAEQSGQHHDELMEKVSEASARESKALEMLENIQRGRRPFL